MSSLKISLNFTDFGEELPEGPSDPKILKIFKKIHDICSEDPLNNRE